MRFTRRIFVLFLLLTILHPDLCFSYQASHEEFNHLIDLLWQSDRTSYPIGNLISVLGNDQTHPATNAYVVLYPASAAEKIKYSDQLIDQKFMKVLAMRVYSTLDEYGNSVGLTPFSEADINDRLKNIFEINFPDSRIRFQFENNHFILSTEMLVEFADDVPMGKLFPTLDFIEKGIEDAWTGTVLYQGREIPLITDVTVTDSLLSFGNRKRLDRFQVYISEKIVRSFVKRDTEWFRYGRWEVPTSSAFETKQLYAHEFGHFIGFDDAYTDIAYFDLNGNLLSNSTFISTPIQSTLKLLSPFSWIDEFHKFPPEHYQNIMASPSLGHVLPEHLLSIVRAYAPMMLTAQQPMFDQ